MGKQRKEKTAQKCKINLRNKDLNVAIGVINAFENFGRDVLNTEFEFEYDNFPISPDGFKRDNSSIDVDSYNTAAQTLFEKYQRKGLPLFLGAITDSVLFAEGCGKNVYATSWSYVDMDKLRQGIH